MKVDLHKNGYIKNIHDWNPKVASWLSKQQNIILTSDHWQIIYLIRLFYKKYQVSPPIRVLVNLVKKQLGPNKGSLYLHKLFPGGAAKQATLIAGLPKPVHCV